MLAVRFFGIEDVRVENIDRVSPSPGQALVKIIYGGICGSDLHIYRKGMFVESIPETMGHEFIGRIESAPTDSGFKPGDIVVGDPRVTCGQCQGCTTGNSQCCSRLGFIGEVSPGGFAEYLAIDPAKLIKLGDNVDTRQGALVEPLAVAVHACHFIKRTEHALVIGAGPIGLLIAYLLKKQYGVAEVAVADIDPYRLELAKKAGADLLVGDLNEVSGKYDCIVDAVGLEKVLNTALEIAAVRGCIYVSAIYEEIPVCDINLVVGKELSIIGNNGYNFDDMKEAADLINSGQYDLSWLISRTVPAINAPEAFRALVEKNKKDSKILIDFSQL